MSVCPPVILRAVDGVSSQIECPATVRGKRVSFYIPGADTQKQNELNGFRQMPKGSGGRRWDAYFQSAHILRLKFSTGRNTLRAATSQQYQSQKEFHWQGRRIFFPLRGGPFRVDSGVPVFCIRGNKQLEFDWEGPIDTSNCYHIQLPSAKKSKSNNNEVTQPQHWTEAEQYNVASSYAPPNHPQQGCMYPTTTTLPPNSTLISQPFNVEAHLPPTVSTKIEAENVIGTPAQLHTPTGTFTGLYGAPSLFNDHSLVSHEDDLNDIDMDDERQEEYTGHYPTTEPSRRSPSPTLFSDVDDFFNSITTSEDRSVPSTGASEERTTTTHEPPESDHSSKSLLSSEESSVALLQTPFPPPTLTTHTETGGTDSHSSSGSGSGSPLTCSGSESANSPQSPLDQCTVDVAQSCNIIVPKIEQNKSEFTSMEIPISQVVQNSQIQVPSVYDHSVVYKAPATYENTVTYNSDVNILGALRFSSQALFGLNTAVGNSLQKYGSSSIIPSSSDSSLYHPTTTECQYSPDQANFPQHVINIEHADYAHWYPFDKSADRQILKPKMVAYLTNQGTLSHSSNKGAMVSIISFKPGCVAGVPPKLEDKNEGAELCTSGCVPVISHRPIRRGQRLVPSPKGDGTVLPTSRIGAWWSGRCLGTAITDSAPVAKPAIEDIPTNPLTHTDKSKPKHSRKPKRKIPSMYYTEQPVMGEDTEHDNEAMAHVNMSRLRIWPRILVFSVLLTTVLCFLSSLGMGFIVPSIIHENNIVEIKHDLGNNREVPGNTLTNNRSITNSPSQLVPVNPSLSGCDAGVGGTSSGCMVVMWVASNSPTCTTDNGIYSTLPQDVIEELNGPDFQVTHEESSCGCYALPKPNRRTLPQKTQYPECVLLPPTEMPLAFEAMLDLDEITREKNEGGGKPDGVVGTMYEDMDMQRSDSQQMASAVPLTGVDLYGSDQQPLPAAGVEPPDDSLSELGAAQKTSTHTSTITPTMTGTATMSETGTVTLTTTPTYTSTMTNTATGTASPSPTSTPTRTPTVTRTPTPSRSRTQTATTVPTHTITQTDTITFSTTRTPTRTPTDSTTRSITNTRSGTPTPTSPLTVTPTPTYTRSRTPSYHKEGHKPSAALDGSLSPTPEPTQTFDITTFITNQVTARIANRLSTITGITVSHEDIKWRVLSKSTKYSDKYTSPSSPSKSSYDDEEQAVLLFSTSLLVPTWKEQGFSNTQVSFVHEVLQNSDELLTAMNELGAHGLRLVAVPPELDPQRT